LQIRDCIGVDQFPLTQEALATMLSVQRPTVTLVAGLLRRAGALDYQRGRVTVVDRAALEAVACSCYHVIRARLIDAPA
jgi:Mn-dependent DtxR family transcriptional regulator